MDFYRLISLFIRETSKLDRHLAGDRTNFSLSMIGPLGEKT
jgi:hypothetical protein